MCALTVNIVSFLCILIFFFIFLQLNVQYALLPFDYFSQFCYNKYAHSKEKKKGQSCV